MNNISYEDLRYHIQDSAKHAIRLTDRNFDFTTRTATTFVRRDIDSLCITVMLEKLQRYENLEEDGLFLRLPCKIGDNVYQFYADDCGNDCCMDNCEKCKDAYWKIIQTEFKISMFDEIGKSVFLTQAEAEASLKKKY